MVQRQSSCARLLGAVFWMVIAIIACNVGIVGKAIAGPVVGLSLNWPVPGYSTNQPLQDYAEFNSLVPPNYKHHAGLDIPAPVGTPVVAAAGGTARVIRLVDFSQKTHCFGNAVIIDHNGLAATLYGHLQSTSILNGPVSQGQQIGTVGNTLGETQTGGPGSCGSIGYHLHFELKNNAFLGTGTTSDGVGPWGYTPTNPVTGNPSLADHPDSWGFHDPILNLHSGITDTITATVVVTSLGSGVGMRTGPGTSYRSIGSTLVVGQQFKPIREYNTATTGCSKGWYQITNINGQYFTNSVSAISWPDVWVCQGNGTEDWVIPVAVPPPSVTTNAATSIGQTGATLSTSVNPNGASTTLYFDYGTTAAYGSSVTYGNIGAGTTIVTLPMSISSLSCSTLYYFRARATNSGGTTNGNVRTFTTSACTQAPPTVTTNTASGITAYSGEREHPFWFMVNT